MPEHTFTGHCPHTYPASRDRLGRPIGEVEPYEPRDLAAPLDHMWRETTDEDRAAWAKILAGREAAGEDVDEDDEAQGGSGQDAASTVPPPGLPRPAPPAVIPQSAGNDTQEG